MDMVAAVLAPSPNASRGPEAEIEFDGPAGWLECEVDIDLICAWRHCERAFEDLAAMGSRHDTGFGQRRGKGQDAIGRCMNGHYRIERKHTGQGQERPAARTGHLP